MGKSPAINVKNLGCARGPVQVLSGVNFEVSTGEALILRGPNGSGKTTLLRTIAGLTPPSDGVIEVAADAIAYAAHANGLKAQLTVAENLSFWAGIYGTTDITPAVEAFDLAHLADRRAGELSAGQTRRLSLARLLVTERPIWALDEPTVSLDAENTARFATAVLRHLEQGGSALIATHIDLGLTGRDLDVAQFAAKPTDTANDPFAEAVE